MRAAWDHAGRGVRAGSQDATHDPDIGDRNSPEAEYKTARTPLGTT
ncbi:hypothetical protein [Streptomyces sp. NPDC001604]